MAGTLYLLVIGLLATDALDLADVCLERMLADAETRASIPAQAFVLVHRGWVSLRRGAMAPAEADARTALELLTAHDIQLGHQVRAGPPDRGPDRGRRDRRRRPGAARERLRRRRFPPAWRATPCWRRGACCASLRAGRARDSTTWSSTAATTSSGGLRTRWRRAGGRTRRSRCSPWATTRRRAAWRPRTSSGPGDGGRPAASASRCAPPGWSRAESRASTGCARPSASSRGRRRGSSTPARSPTWAPPCAAPTVRSEARGPLQEGLDLAHRCGARALVERRGHRAARGRRHVERPVCQRHRAAHRLRAPSGGVRGRGPEQSRDRAGAVRDPQDGRDPSRPRLPEARHRGAKRARARPGRRAPRLKIRELNQGAPRRHGRDARLRSIRPLTQPRPGAPGKERR